MSNVILFGAGASIGAGYPSAKGLLNEIEGYARKTPDLDFEHYWSVWENFRDSEPPDEILGLLLRASNPEIILSALDLFVALDENSGRSLLSIISALMKDPNNHLNTNEYDMSLRRLENQRVMEAQQAQTALLRCLEYFLNAKRRTEADQPQKRDYLRETFRDLRFGDTIITFNWDTTAERTLGEMRLWNPTTGYGFEKGLIRISSKSPNMTKKEFLPSPVRVLKLHGSVGWNNAPLENELVYFHNTYLLKNLPIYFPDEENPVLFSDPDFHQIEHSEPVIVAPTFLKAIPAGKDMQRLWYLAGKALAEATNIQIWGYSLPQSDAAARVLLNPLRFRLSEDDVKIVVTDPNAETRDRWDAFLGSNVSQDGKLGDN